MSIEQKIIDAMRADPDRRWSIAGLAQATGVGAEGIKTTVQSMRWSGKMEFDRLQLSASLRGAPIVFSRAPRAPVTKDLCPEHARSTAEGSMPVASRDLAQQVDDEARALQVLLGDYLRSARPAFTHCFLRLSDWAVRQGVKLPSASTMRRRVEAEAAKLGKDNPRLLVSGVSSRRDTPLGRASEAKTSPERELLGEDLAVRPDACGFVDVGAAKAAYAEHAKARGSVAPKPVVIGVDLATKPDMHVEAELTPVSIADQVAAEAAEAGRRRRAARVSGHTGVIDRAPASTAEAVATALVEDLDDAMLAAKRAWPDQWWRIVTRARAQGVRPGVVFGEIVEAGLNAGGGR